MKVDTWMPMYWGDYLKDTIGFSLAEHGAYLLTIAAYWNKGGPLTEAEAISIAGELTPKIKPFFQVSDGLWRHKRIDEELVKARELHAQRVKAGKLAAARRWQGHIKRNASVIPNAQQTNTPSPSQTNNNGGGPALTAARLPTRAEFEAEQKRIRAYMRKVIHEDDDLAPKGKETQGKGIGQGV